MNTSPLRHPLAVLRHMIGLTQEGMADLVKRARRTVQAVELGHMKLGWNFAQKISEETGVDTGWLMDADPTKPPLNIDLQPYERTDFEKVQSAKTRDQPTKATPSFRDLVIDAHWNILPLIIAQLAANQKGDKESRIAQYRISKLGQALTEEFGWLKGDLKEFVETCRFVIYEDPEYKMRGGKRRPKDPADDPEAVEITTSEFPDYPIGGLSCICEMKVFPGEPPLLSSKPRSPRSRKGGEPPQSHGQ